MVKYQRGPASCACQLENCFARALHTHWCCTPNHRRTTNVANTKSSSFRPQLGLDAWREGRCVWVCGWCVWVCVGGVCVCVCVCVWWCVCVCGGGGGACWREGRGWRSPAHTTQHPALPTSPQHASHPTAANIATTTTTTQQQHMPQPEHRHCTAPPSQALGEIRNSHHVPQHVCRHSNHLLNHDLVSKLRVCCHAFLPPLPGPAGLLRRLLLVVAAPAADAAADAAAATAAAPGGCRRRPAGRQPPPEAPTGDKVRCWWAASA